MLPCDGELVLLARSPTISCPDPDILEHLLLGLLPGAETESLSLHVEACAACAAVIDGLQAEDMLVQSARTPVAETAAPDEAVEALIGRLTALPGGGRDTPPRGLPHSDLAGMLRPAEKPGELGRLGPYRILGVLGAGGMGVVFRAEDTALGRQVALKTLQPALAASPAARQRFLREARAAAAVHHDHVITIHHVGDDGGIPFLSMPLLTGESLEQLLHADGDPLSLEDSVRIARQTAEGLAAAHSQGVVHRDVKTANIWLERNAGRPRFRVKLLDFGLAQAANDASPLTDPGALAGTPACVAPELLRGEAVDGRCDLFGLGCVLYRMLTGQAPFHGPDKLSTLMAVASAAPVPPRTLNPMVPPPLADLVMRLLEKDPSRRPESAAQAAAELAALEEQGFDLPPPSRRRESRRALIAALVAACVAVAGIIYLSSGSTAPLAAPIPAGPPAEATAERWTRETAALSGSAQVEALRARLIELNPGFDGEVGYRFEADRLAELHFMTNAITDITPVRALPHLRILVCRGSSVGKGRLRDLTPLRGMQLEYLDCSCNVSLADLEPLRGMPLHELVCWCTPVESLWPLQGMPLRTLDCNGCYVTDLSPLKDLPLVRLAVRVNNTPPDLGPVAGAPLQELHCEWRPDRDAPILRAIPTLRRINHRPVADVWKDLDAGRGEN